jgi:hypothetical protein
MSELRDLIEQTLDEAQTHHLNGYPQHARSVAQDAIRLLDKLIDAEREATGG